ncbi:MAG TPA: hypothetical protein VGB70_03835 [Allosphingosinicella sp.]|jgi:hypothetical protein
MTQSRPRSAAFWSALAAAALLAAPALAAPGRLGGGEQLGVSLGRIVGALIVCIVIAVLAALLLRQRSGRMDLRAVFQRLSPRTPAIDVVETRRLSPNADICIVRHDGREYLLLLLAGGAQVLNEQAVAEATQCTEADVRCD